MMLQKRLQVFKTLHSEVSLFFLELKVSGKMRGMKTRLFDIGANLFLTVQAPYCAFVFL